MAKAYLAVRAEVPEAERSRFDHWYETDHLPWALRAFGAQRAWRCWSRSDPAVHVAFYEFDSVDAAEAATAPEKINKDAHSAWLIKITLKNPAELNSLLSAQDYEKFVSEEAGK